MTKYRNPVPRCTVVSCTIKFFAYSWTPFHLKQVEETFCRKESKIQLKPKTFRMEVFTLHRLNYQLAIKGLLITKDHYYKPSLLQD